MARVAMLTLVAALTAIVATTGAASQDEPAAGLPSLPTVPGTPSPMMPRNLTCTSTLLGCMLYYQNSTAGPGDSLEMCCAPARKVLDGDMDCLCDGLNNQMLVAEIGLDVKKGMTMFPRCGVKIPDNVCSSSNAGDPASANRSPASSSKSGSGASLGTQFSYSSFLVFLFAMWPLLP